MTTTTAPARNWAGNITFGAARVHRPGSVDEVRRVVAGAGRVRALGSGHSFNRIADTTGDLVRVDRLPRRIEVDAGSGQVTVGAGMRYAEVAAALHAEGFALANMASLPHISVAGSVATGTHGSGNARQGLASAVSGLEIVGPQGDLTRLGRSDEGFAGAVVSLGALGVVVGVTLDVEPGFEVAQWVYGGVPLDALGGSFAEISGAAYSVSAFTVWHGGQATVVLKRRTDAEDAGHPGERWQGGRLAGEPWHPIPGMPAEYCTQQLGVPGPWHERLPHFRPEFTPSRGEELQSELFLPRGAAAEAFGALRGLGGAMAPVLQVSEVRTIAADELWLSPSHGRDSLAVHFTWVKDTEAVLPVLEAIEEALLPLGARPHWGKLTTTTPQAAGAGYERLADFRRLASGHDPDGKFRNPFLDALLTE
jgi:alditol oxidase